MRNVEAMHSGYRVEEDDAGEGRKRTIPIPEDEKCEIEAAVASANISSSERDNHASKEHSPRGRRSSEAQGWVPIAPSEDCNAHDRALRIDMNDDAADATYSNSDNGSDKSPSSSSQQSFSMHASIPDASGNMKDDRPAPGLIGWKLRFNNMRAKFGMTDMRQQQEDEEGETPLSTDEIEPTEKINYAQRTQAEASRMSFIGGKLKQWKRQFSNSSDAVEQADTSETHSNYGETSSAYEQRCKDVEGSEIPEPAYDDKEKKEHRLHSSSLEGDNFTKAAFIWSAICEADVCLEREFRSRILHICCTPSISSDGRPQQVKSHSDVDEDNENLNSVIRRFINPLTREIPMRELPELLPLGGDMLLLDERLKVVRFKVL